MSNSISLSLALDNSLQAILATQLNCGNLDQYATNFIQQEWNVNKGYVENNLIQAASMSGNPSQISQDYVDQAVAKFVNLAVNKLRSAATPGYGGGYGGGNYGGGYNYAQPLNVGNLRASSLTPLPGRHGNIGNLEPISINPQATTKTRETAPQKVQGDEVDQKAAGYDGDTVKIIQASRDDYPCINVGSNITTVRATKVMTNVISFNVYTIKSLIPEDSDAQFLRQFNDMKGTSTDFILSGVYPKYQILDFPGNEMRTLQSQIVPLLKQADSIKSIIKIIKKSSHHTYTELERVIIENINRLLRTYAVSSEFQGEQKLHIDTFDDIVDLLMVREGPLLKLASHNNYRQHISSLILHIFKRWFDKTSIVLNSKEDIHTIQCCSQLKVRENELHEKVNVNDLSEADKNRLYELLDEQCIMLIPTYVTFTNIFPKELLNKLGQKEADYVHNIKSVNNLFEATMFSVLQPIKSIESRLVYDFSNYYLYSFINDLTINLNVGLSVDDNLTMCI